MAEYMDAQADRISDEQFLVTLNIASIVLFFVFILGYVVYHVHRKNKFFAKRSIDATDPLAKKFVPKDGVTIYGHPMSPAHRQITAVLEELNVKYRTVLVEMHGECNSESYLKISPRGEVPCVLFRNTPQFFPGSPEPHYMFDSNVITEFLDRKVCPKEADRLYPPGGSLERLEVYRWQHWNREMSQYLGVFAEQNVQFVLTKLWKKHKKNQQNSANTTSNQRFHSSEEMQLIAIAAYRLVQLVEKALVGKQYLVADRFTAADVNVCATLCLLPCSGLPLPRKHFPNVKNYMKRIGKRRCMKQSCSGLLSLSQWLFGNPWLRKVVLSAARLRSGQPIKWFDGAKFIDRALADFDEVMSCLAPDEDYMGQTILYDYKHHPDSWVLKLLLMYKVSSSLENLPAEAFRERWQEVGNSMRMEELDSVDLIGRQNGSCVTQRVQLSSGDVIMGSSAMFHYFASVSGQDLAHMQYIGERLNTDLKQSALEVQSWLSWCATLCTDVMYLLMENYIFSHHLHKKYSANEILEFRTKPFYSTTYLDIIRVYSQRLDPSSETFLRFRESYPFLRLGAINDNIITEHIGALHKRLQQVDSKLEKSAYLVGESVTLADIVVFCHLLFMPFLSMKISTHKYPHLCRWISELKTIPVLHTIDRQLQSTMNALFT